MIEKAIRTVRSDVQDVASTVSEAATAAATEAVERLRDKTHDLRPEDVEALVHRMLEAERADQLPRKDYAYKVRIAARVCLVPRQRSVVRFRSCTTAQAPHGTTSLCLPSTWRAWLGSSC